MFGTINSDQTMVSFAHLCGMMRISLNGLTETVSGSLKLSATNITGEAALQVSGEEEAATATLGAISGGGNEVTVSFTDQTGDFTIDVPVPADTYTNGIEATLQLGSAEASVFKTTENFSIAAGKIKLMPAISQITINGTTIGFSREVTTLEEAQSALDAGTPSITVKDVEVNSDYILIVPSSGQATNIQFASLTGSNTLTIKAKDGETVSQNVTIKLDNGEGETASKLSIDLPDSHVTLEGSGYNEISAITGGETLVVSAGVKVNKLEIAGGNLKVLGTVKELSRASSNTEKVAVVSEGAADIQKVTNPEYFTFTSLWDGASKVTPTATDDDTYAIYTAAQLASFQSVTIPESTTGINLTATMTSDATLYADIDLDNHPWLGMVLDASKTFDGGSKTISNILIQEFILDEQSIYTPAACVGLFAATKKESEIKNVTIDGFRAEGKAADAKWAGALVGYSYGTKAYTDCHAKNVTINSESSDAYRLGGLIGFIANCAGVAVTLTDCSAEDVSIKGSFSIGGLVGTLQGNLARTFANCSTKNVTLSINDASCATQGAWDGRGTFYGPYAWAAYMSKFVGDIAAGTITFTNCSVDAQFTEAELTAFACDRIADYQYTSTSTAEEIASAKANATYYKVGLGSADGSKFLPLHVDGGTIIVGGTTLTEGTDYNNITEVE